MTTISHFTLDTNRDSATREVYIPYEAATTCSIGNTFDNTFDERDLFDIEAIAEWVTEEQVRLQEQYIQKATPVRVADDRGPGQL